mmetsp:Transcript_28493/g.45924  ORF Transcript_28493/g.45924 Transcript_28493/m.45924 type:complete len:1144 (-) Transcript_28493:594-4025(-)|eukprot:CAMPEP_0203747088 /NCGR_PEP_ID=MMETSP0098-20131031/2340_1 /ASSEMBLY_ACC=CAM_ASM_000208 /TAXON_ID=96639 /ORGANISM=" , Strain NY0313808BC1" /LENGTH=1143 /DNA_ID=CAMNT_0050635407 /DNA_START=312 /DNA_END=3743 /DNA_ORIENTATION=-
MSRVEGQDADGVGGESDIENVGQVNAQSVEGSGDGDTKGTEKEEVAGKSGMSTLSWMGSWTKKTMQSAAKAQSQIGELLAIPSRKYKEINVENDLLRKRVYELSSVLCEQISIDGPIECGGLLVLKSESAVVIGTDRDVKLLGTQWYRKRNEEEEWVIIEKATKGYYRTCIDDVGCEIRVVVSFTKLFCRLLIPVVSTGDKAESPKKEVGMDQSPSATSLSSLNSAQSSAQQNGHNEKITITRTSTIVLSKEVQDSLKKYQKGKCEHEHVFYKLKNSQEPLYQSFLKVSARTKDHMSISLLRTLLPHLDDNHGEDEDDAYTEEGSSEDGDIFDDPYEKRVVCSASFPKNSVRVYAHGDNSTGFTLRMKGHLFDIHCTSGVERDALIAFVRAARSQVVDVEHGYDFDADKVLVQTGADSYNFLECAYPQVWGLLGYEDLKERSEQINSPVGSGASSSMFKFVGFGGNGAKKKVFRSVTSLLSSALDPLNDLNGGNDSALRSPVHQSNGGTYVDQSPGVKKTAKIRADSPVTFDLYKEAGFGEPYSVELDLEEGEGLGITLSLFHLVNKNGSSHPVDGAACVCVTGFCPIVRNGEECRGQLERCGKIRPGDALVSIGDIPIEPAPVRTMGDLSSYTKCSLSRVSQIVNKVRYAGVSNDSRRPHNPKCLMKFTFAYAGTGHAGTIQFHNKAKEEVEDMKNRLYEANTRVSSMVMKCEQRLETQGVRTRSLCNVVEEERSRAERAVIEKNLAIDELNSLKDAVYSFRSRCEAERKALELAVVRANEKANAFAAEKEAAEARIEKLESNMTEMATEGECWVNTIGTKEEALRALETDLRAQQIKYENLQCLLDNATAERNRLRQELVEANDAIREAKKSVADMQIKVDQANDEADALTSRLRMEAEESQNSMQRQRHLEENFSQQMSDLKDQLAVANTHSTALKEANQTAEHRAEQASRDRQAAEIALLEEKGKNAAAQKEILSLRRSLTDATTGAPISVAANGEVASSAASPKSMSGEIARYKQNELRYANKLAELEGANELLRSQLKSYKSRVQSLAAEVSKVAKVDELVEENNNLTVNLQLERASRLEAEDELTAYKRALRQFAAQAQKDEREGSGEPWTRRPKIFDHLYKTLKSEDGNNGTTPN